MDNNIENLRQKTVSGIFWKGMERISAQLVSVIVSIVLARLLFPEDYSVVSIVAIFFSFCNIFISGGLSSALIQKKDADVIDYSSVFFAQMLMASIFYVVMFFVAPALAKLYNKDILIPVIRVMALTFFINGYKSVLSAKISSDLKFRKFFWSTIIGTVISAFVGIIMAYNGFGAWALVAQQMTNSFVDTLILTFTSHTKLRFVFSFSRFKQLFNFGGKIFLASIITVAYDEAQPLIVGIKYSTADLAYYNKGSQYPNLITSISSDTLSSSLFPAMAKVQDDKDAILNFTRSFMQVASFLTFPMMLGFFAVAENFVSIVLTDKWLPVVPYVMIFCLANMLQPIQKGNLQAIRAIGRSDIILILEIIKKSTYAVVIFLFVFFTDSPILLALSAIINSVFASLANTFPNRKLIGYRYKYQLADLLPNFITALVMCGIVYFMNYIQLNIYLLFVLQIVTGILVYFGLNLLIRNKSMFYLFDIVKGVFNKDGKNKKYD